MARYNMHPVQGGGHYHDVKLYKDRRLTLAELEKRKLAKKLKKKRRQGGK